MALNRGGTCDVEKKKINPVAKKVELHHLYK